MKFHEVSKAMDKGKKIKLKDWDNAYWYKKGGIIINHDEEGLVSCSLGNWHWESGLSI